MFKNFMREKMEELKAKINKETIKNKNCEYKFIAKNDGECCRLMPVYDPETKEMLGCLACEVISDEHCKKIRDLTTKKEESLGKLHAEAEVPHPLMLDEVSASFISWLRVQSWEDLGTDFGGYRIGRILAYILDVLNEKIEDSTAATIKVDVPLYEQCSTVSCKCGGKCKHNESETAAIREELKHYYFYPAIKSLKEIKNLICNPTDAKTEMELMKNQHERLNKIYKFACEGLGEEVPECQ